MSKHATIKFKFSGQWDDVNHILRQFTTSDLLKRINRESVCLLQNPKNSDIAATKRVSFRLYHKYSSVPQKNEEIITAYTLIDLAYYSILSSNDYRGKIIDSDEELYALTTEVKNYINMNQENIALNPQYDQDDFFIYLWGFAGEQFKTQSLGTIFKNARRELYILFGLDDGCKFKIQDVILEEIGTSWQNVAVNLLYAWEGFNQVDTLSDIENKYNWNEKRSEEFENIIERYTANYNEIRSHKLGRQILYAKPYIKTQKGEIVSINTYLNLFLYEHAILWLVRDHFQESQLFTNYFGGLFEIYFEKLLSECLEKNEYKKIEEGKTKKADWEIKIGNHKILVEQKSSIMRLSAKQQLTDINAIKTFASRSVLEAIGQLDNTEKEFNNGSYIKIILLYEDYLNNELLKSFMNMSECNIKNDKLFWLVTIDEMEKLLYLYKNDKDLFEKVLSEKIDRESKDSRKGKSLIQIFNENGIYKNMYLEQEKFNKYDIRFCWDDWSNCYSECVCRT